MADVAEEVKENGKKVKERPDFNVDSTHVAQVKCFSFVSNKEDIFSSRSTRMTHLLSPFFAFLVW